MWDADSVHEIHAFTRHSAQILSISAAKDIERVVTAGLDGDIHIWDLKSRKSVAKLRGHAGGVRAVTISRCGKYVPFRAAASMCCPEGWISNWCCGMLMQGKRSGE